MMNARASVLEDGYELQNLDNCCTDNIRTCGCQATESKDVQWGHSGRNQNMDMTLFIT